MKPTPKSRARANQKAWRECIKHLRWMHKDALRKERKAWKERRYGEALYWSQSAFDIELNADLVAQYADIAKGKKK